MSNRTVLLGSGPPVAPSSSSTQSNPSEDKPTSLNERFSQSTFTKQRRDDFNQRSSSKRFNQFMTNRTGTTYQDEPNRGYNRRRTTGYFQHRVTNTRPRFRSNRGGTRGGRGGRGGRGRGRGGRGRGRGGNQKDKVTHEQMDLDLDNYMQQGQTKEETNNTTEN